MQNEVNFTWHFSQPPQEVWEYLTQPELLEQWLMKTDFQPIVGHKFRFLGPKGLEHFCEVLDVKPFTKLSYSWQRNSISDNKPFDSKVVWTLVPVENGTDLHLVHDGFRALEDYTGHNKGWTMLVTGLVDRLNAIAK